jgi:hypothetical protein
MKVAETEVNNIIINKNLIINNEVNLTFDKIIKGNRQGIKFY